MNFSLYLFNAYHKVILKQFSKNINYLMKGESKTLCVKSYSRLIFVMRQ